MEDNNLNTLEDNYLEIIAKNILNDIKKYVKHNNITLEKNRAAEIDRKMIEVIRSVILNEKVEFFFEVEDDEEDFEKNIKDGIMPSLTQYYVALYFDNLDLLHKLLDEEFSFGYYKNGNMALFTLDKRISSQFDEDKYIEIVENNREIFVHFYRSLYCNKKEVNEEEIITKFCNIIKTNNKNNIKEINNFLTVRVLSNFSEEEIYKLNGVQKSNLLYPLFSDKAFSFKVDLIKKYNFSKGIIYWDYFMEYFSEEEILKLTDEDISLYEYMLCYDYGVNNAFQYKINAISYLKEIKKINPEFNYKLPCIVYDILNIKQIMSMSEKCAKKIDALCADYWYCQDRTDNNFTENLLRKLVKETYYKDTVKRNVKKLIKRK